MDKENIEAVIKLCEIIAESNYTKGKKEGIEKCIDLMNKINPNAKILFALKKHLDREKEKQR